MVVRFEPKRLIIGNVDSEGFRILQRALWISFFRKFSGFNLEVTRQFEETFDGKIAQIGNLTLHLSENLIAQVTGLPHTGEKWFKKKHIDEKACTPYINKSKKVHNWVNGITKSCLRSP